jgi:hypothetical protein
MARFLHMKNPAVWVGVLLSSLVAAGCEKAAGLGPVPPSASRAETAALPSLEAPTEKPGAADPATVISFKTDVPRDKVEQILSIYAANQGSDVNGSDLYRIALFASQHTSIPTDKVGAVILSYKAAYGNAGFTAAKDTKAVAAAKESKDLRTN